jgi:hypothetical protein
MATISLLVSAAHRYGKRAVLVHVLLLEGFIYLGAAFVPGSFFRDQPWALIPVGMLIGVGQVGKGGEGSAEGRVGKRAGGRSGVKRGRRGYPEFLG